MNWSAMPVDNLIDGGAHVIIFPACAGRRRFTGCTAAAWGFGNGFPRNS